MYVGWQDIPNGSVLFPFETWIINIQVAPAFKVSELLLYESNESPTKLNKYFFVDPKPFTISQSIINIVYFGIVWYDGIL